MTVAELGLTPSQHAETENADADLVTAWLEATAANTHVKNRAAWFLAGIRTGKPPQTQTDHTTPDAIRKAERWLENAGYLFDRETEIEDELFGPHGILRTNTDPHLRRRLLDLWRTRRPKGEQAEAEHAARGERWQTIQAGPPDPDADADLEELFTP